MQGWTQRSSAAHAPLSDRKAVGAMMVEVCRVVPLGLVAQTSPLAGGSIEALPLLFSPFDTPATPLAPLR